MERVKIEKTIYGLGDFNNVVDVSFKQLFKSTEDNPIEPEINVDEFFNQYDVLFYSIPLSGSDNSHLALATRSLDYLGISLEDLQNEIAILREENINIKNQIILLSEIDTGTLI